MNKMSKGLQALHDAIKPPFSDVGGSASDAIADAIRAMKPDEQADEQRVAELPPEMHAEQSSPVPTAAPTAPSLFVSGIEAIRQAGAATEQDRIREYGLLAEIDAKGKTITERNDVLDEEIKMQEEELRTMTDEAEANDKTLAELAVQRAETVDRIVKLNQTAIDHEAARLRRG